MRHRWRVAPKHLHKNENPALLSYISVATPMYTSQSDVFSINTALTQTRVLCVCARACLCEKHRRNFSHSCWFKQSAEHSSPFNQRKFVYFSASFGQQHQPLASPSRWFIIIFISWRVVCNEGGLAPVESNADSSFNHRRNDRCCFQLTSHPNPILQCFNVSLKVHIKFFGLNSFGT